MMDDNTGNRNTIASEMGLMASGNKNIKSREGRTDTDINVDVEQGNIHQDQDVFRARSNLLLKQLSEASHLSQSSYFDDDDNGEEDPSNLIAPRVKEPPHHFIDENMEIWGWVTLHHKTIFAIIVTVLSVIASVLSYYVVSDQVILDGMKLWIWLALPAVIIGDYWVCNVVELTLLYYIRYAVRYLAWRKGIKYSMHDIKNIYHDDRFVAALCYLEFGFALTSALPIFSIIMFVRESLFLGVRLKVTSDSYGHCIEELEFMEGVADLLCASSPLQRYAVRAARIDRQRMQFMDRVGLITLHQFSFPLRFTRNHTWVRSDDYHVVINNEKEMAIASLVIYDTFLRPKQDEAVLFCRWSKIFSNNAEATRAFRILFDKECWLTQAFNETQFAAAFVRMFQIRRKLKDRLIKFENTARLLKNLADLPYCLVFIFAMAYVLGWDARNLTISLSAVLVSLSFGVGATCEKFVSGVVFVFGTNPYEVNDLVEINDQIYTVNRLTLTQTEFISDTGKLSIMDNFQLRSDVLKITNLSRSSNAVAKCEIDIAFDTPTEVLEKLRKSMCKKLSRDKAHWRPGVHLLVTDLHDRRRQTLIMTAQSTLPWRSLELFTQLQSDFISSVREKILRLNISHESNVT